MYERIYDGVDLHEIKADGTVLDKGSKSNGSNEVYCKNDRNHEIPDELQEAVLDLVE